MDAFNKVQFEYNSLDEAFPKIDPGVKPLGSRVLVQIRTPKLVTKGGIHLTKDTQETELYNTQIGKVIGLGPLAFCDRKTMQPWPEGAWFGLGDYVRIPKYGGDRWSVKFGTEEGEEAIMVIFNDLDIIGLVTGDPLVMKAFI